VHFAEFFQKNDHGRPQGSSVFFCVWAPFLLIPGFVGSLPVFTCLRRSPSVRTLSPPLSLCQVSPVGYLVGSLIALSVPLLVSHVSLSCIHKLRYMFCQVELFSCRHWQRELFQAFRIQQQMCSSRMTAFVKHAPAFEFWVVVVTRHRSRLKGHTSFRFRLASRLTHLFANWNRTFLCCFVTW